MLFPQISCKCRSHLATHNSGKWYEKFRSRRRTTIKKRKKLWIHYLCSIVLGYYNKPKLYKLMHIIFNSCCLHLHLHLYWHLFIGCLHLLFSVVYIVHLHLHLHWLLFIDIDLLTLFCWHLFIDINIVLLTCCSVVLLFCCSVVTVTRFYSLLPVLLFCSLLLLFAFFLLPSFLPSWLADSLTPRCARSFVRAQLSWTYLFCS